jgi:hypothetical protein
MVTTYHSKLPACPLSPPPGGEAVKGLSFFSLELQVCALRAPPLPSPFTARQRTANIGKKNPCSLPREKKRVKKPDKPTPFPPLLSESFAAPVIDNDVALKSAWSRRFWKCDEQNR